MSPGGIGGGLSSGAGRGSHYTAAITIRIIDGKAHRVLRRTQTETRKTGKSFDRMGRKNRTLSRIISTFTKALISMAAVLVAFNALITGPQFALSILIQGFKGAIDYAAQFEQRVLALQTVLATKIQFKSDPIENFIATGLIAENAMNRLAARAHETVGSIDNVTLVMQSMLSAGADEMASSVSELIDLAILMTNAIAAVTPGQQLERQLSEEPRSLITGRLRATSVLANLLFGGDRKAFNAFLKDAKENNNLLEQLTKLLRGADLAATKFGKTYEGVKTSVESIAQLASARGLRGGGPLETFLESAANFVNSILSDAPSINLLASAISSSFSIVRDAIVETFDLEDVFSDTGTFVSKLIEGIRLLTHASLVFIGVMKTIIDIAIKFYYALVLLVKIAGEFHIVVGAIVGGLAFGWVGIFLGGIIGYLLGAENVLAVLKLVLYVIDLLAGIIRRELRVWDRWISLIWGLGEAAVAVGRQVTSGMTAQPEQMFDLDITGIMNSITSVIGDAVGHVKSEFMKLDKPAARAADYIKDTFTITFASIADAAEWMRRSFDSTASGMSAKFDWIRDSYRLTLEGMQNKASTASTIIGDAFNAIFGKESFAFLRSSFASTMEGIRGKLRWLGESYSLTMDGLASKTAFIGRAQNSALNSMRSAYASVLQSVGSASSWIDASFKSTISSMRNQLSEFKSYISPTVGDIYRSFETAFSGIKDVFAAAAGHFRSAWDSVIRWFKDFVGPTAFKIMAYIINDFKVFFGWMETINDYATFVLTLGAYGRDPLADMMGEVESYKFSNKFLESLDKIPSGVSMVVKEVDRLLTSLISTESAFESAVRRMTPWAHAIGVNLIRIEQGLDAVSKAIDDIPQKPLAFNFDQLIEGSEKALKSAGITRRQTSHIRQILVRAFEGILPSHLIPDLEPDARALMEILKSDASSLLQFYNQVQGAILAVDLFPDRLENTEHLSKLKDLAKLLRGEIAALSSEFKALRQSMLAATKVGFFDIFAKPLEDMRIKAFDGLKESIMSFKEVIEDDRVKKEAKKFVEGIKETFAPISLVVEKMRKGGASINDFLTEVKNLIFSWETLGKFAVATVNMLTNAISHAIQGTEKFVDHIKKIIGTVLIQIGTELLAWGLATALTGVFSFNAQLVALGTAAAAAGALLIKLGSKMTGTGAAGASAPSPGGTPEFAFSQQQIAARQYFSDASGNLRTASENLYGATENIQGVKPGEVFMRGAKENGGVGKVLSKGAREGENFGATRDSALAFQGM